MALFLHLASAKCRKAKYPMHDLVVVLNEHEQLRPAHCKQPVAPLPVEQSCDVISDPREMNNLAGDPVHSVTKLSLREKQGLCTADYVRIGSPNRFARNMTRISRNTRICR